MNYILIRAIKYKRKCKEGKKEQRKVSFQPEQHVNRGGPTVQAAGQGARAGGGAGRAFPGPSDSRLRLRRGEAARARLLGASAAQSEGDTVRDGLVGCESSRERAQLS